MGHCLSCFNNQANADVETSQRQKDEMTEIVTSNQVPTVMISDYPQEEPLLHNNDNSINCYRNSSHITNTNALNSLNEYCSSDTVHKMHVNNDKTPKPFYQKLPSIPRSMSSIGSSESRVSESKINQLFDQYKDSLEDAILAEGIENLCNDLQLNPDDFKVLILAWKLNASQMCRFTKTEFVQGLKSMKSDSIKSIQQKLNDIINELKRDSEQFKDLYRFTFKFGLDVTSGQRILPADIAVLLWRLVFTNDEPPILDRWLSYLEKNPHIRGIPKDTWYMFLNFCEYVGDDLSSYDDTEAWPSLFDDFVEFENDQMNQNVTKNNTKIQD
ncbi:DCN1-like protein 3 [Vanessa tameamea]|uniref:Defective in cullin neddylation protein n=1 Tax=Vanessa tameamea TaxID=334116 RepID=A0A8B8HU27_VANTA|nr:DCN1-like protein 3 [Vanessa tameamea]XP_026488358.1 DCN1-like protein 3 [Vanessa tameamea]XP_026488359.1 DCN1-like protein 3 [Vanessa tameamea]XP_026488360.1 DCN1-like protein 3 [Vanessa tameamea]XP_026488361.1 DCN1-like protein 3 [Vanessa tameamea]